MSPVGHFNQPYFNQHVECFLFSPGNIDLSIDWFVCSQFLGALMQCTNEPDMIADTFLNNVSLRDNAAEITCEPGRR